MLLPAAKQIPTGKGSAYRLNVPYRWVLHSVECNPDIDLTNAASTHAHPPHFWVSMPRRQIIQTVDTGLAAQALEHRSGTVETNHARAIQVEIAGRAEEMHTYPDEWFVWLYEALLAPVAAHHDIDLNNWPEFKTYPSSYGNNGVRFSDAQWLGFNGGCGHEHVPGNSHGDPGAIPTRLLRPAAPPSGDDDDMTPEQDEMLQEVYRQLVGKRFKVGQLVPRALRDAIGGDGKGSLWDLITSKLP